MTTNKPEVVAYPHINKESPEIKGVILRRDPSGTRTWIDPEPLIRLAEYEALQAECEKLRKDAERLKARVAKLEGEDTLWAMLDAIEKALFRKAAPHAWESVVTSAGSNFIVSRRKSKEPANEGDRHA